MNAFLRYLGGLVLAVLLIAAIVWVISRPPSQLEMAESIASANQRLGQIARIKDARSHFVIAMSKLEGVQSTQISEMGDVVIVRFAPLVHIGTDHVRVMCEGIAYKWAAFAGMNQVRCESWYGNKMYAAGTYDGPVPPASAERQSHDEEARAAANQEQSAKGLSALAAMEGKTFAEIEGTHGRALSKKPETGWAEWPKFRARFEGGKVVEVSVKDGRMVTP